MPLMRYIRFYFPHRRPFFDKKEVTPVFSGTLGKARPPTPTPPLTTDTPEGAIRTAAGQAMSYENEPYEVPESGRRERHPVGP
ncbi:hypothetical protein GCM10010517_08330 [Streptosporangium fragile]|uniref:Uncharacterized protein n=1 Tax=Streptosporangium fragile TaxID=46186 RepID=A0ABN3VQM9_9ACTN